MDQTYFYPLLKLVGVMYLACAVHIFVVYTILVKVLAKYSPAKFFKKTFPTLATAFSTSSSAGTIPVSLKACREMGVDDSIASFVIPLGSTINMNGTAIYQGVCALFVAQVFGLDLSISQQLTIVLTATLAAVGTAGSLEPV